MSEKVRFIELTKEKFDALLAGEVENKSIDPNALYFLSNTGQLYKGEDLYSGTTAVSKDASVAATVASNINFVGEGFVVESDPDNPGRVNVSMPFNTAKMNSSYYNSSGGTTNPSVPNISSTNTNGTANTYQTTRYVALPDNTIESGKYYIGSDWNSTTKRNVLNKDVSSISYTTAETFWIPTKTTKFKITLTKYNSDNTTTKVEEITEVITGNGTYSTTNCSVVISSFTEDFMGFKGIAKVTVGVAGMLGGAGRFNIKISHVVGSTEYSKEQTNLFYDDNPGAGSIESGSIKMNTAKLKYLSGVTYIGPGSTVDVSINNVSGVFNKTFLDSVGNINTNCTAAQSYTATDVATASGATLSTVKHTASASVITKSNIAISASKYITDGIKFTSATCSNGWNTNTLSTASTTTTDYPIDTYAAASTSTNEAFTDENYRIKYDSVNSKWISWVSTEALGSTDLKCGEGTKVFKNSTDTTTEHVYYRTFGGTQSSSVGILTLTGTNITETNFVTNKYFDMQISLDGIKWYSIRNLATEDTGIAGVNGIRAQKATYNLDKTTKQIYYAFPAGINTDTNTGVAGKVSKYGIFFKLTIKNPTVVVDNVSIEFK